MRTPLEDKLDTLHTKNKENKVDAASLETLYDVLKGTQGTPVQRAALIRIVEQCKIKRPLGPKLRTKLGIAQANPGGTISTVTGVTQIIQFT